MKPTIKTKGFTLTQLSLFAIVAITVVSQTSLIPFTFLNTVLWPALLLVSIYDGKDSLLFAKAQKVTLIRVCMIGLYSCALALISAEMGYITGLFSLFIKAILMYYVGWSVAPSYRQYKDIHLLFLSYLIASCIYTVWAIRTYVPSLNLWFDSLLYLFKSNNSYGQLYGCLRTSRCHLIVYSKSHISAHS